MKNVTQGRMEKTAGTDVVRTVIWVISVTREMVPVSKVAKQGGHQDFVIKLVKMACTDPTVNSNVAAIASTTPSAIEKQGYVLLVVMKDMSHHSVIKHPKIQACRI
ncbi:uncharacterized protein LOC134261095 [Saccostrea cucullata]|uniref:uncharacterized protein LOC134261095 n=1 Tax=Saccostrea cuccullata TaxID=36930 RepID=UPI002ED619EA